ncbi:MAG: amidohydrolase [Flavobacteriaceae bacterium]
MEKLTTTLIQTQLHWENPEANRKMFSEKIAQISEETDLIILPEMFTTGFSMNARQFAEAENGKTLTWMQEIAAKKNSALTGSIMVKEDNKFFNRLYFVFPDGSFGSYNKRHAFTLAGEERVYSVGNEKLVVAYKGWKICPLICYDLRFPVWSRNTEGYDLVIYVANWPLTRIAAWDALLRARAIENMAYCIGVNRIGFDANGHEYNGHSAVYDVLGEKISHKDPEKAFVETVTLNKNHVEEMRKKLQFLNDRDNFTLL